jgi:hypothetical protein
MGGGFILLLPRGDMGDPGWGEGGGIDGGKGG